MSELQQLLRIFLVNLALGVFSNVSAAQELSPDRNDEILAEIGDVHDALAAAQKQFTSLGEQLQKLSAEVRTLNGDVISLQGGGVVLKEGVLLTTPLERELKALNDQLEKLKAARTAISAQTDLVFDALVKMRLGDGQGTALDLHAFVRRLVSTAAELIANNSVVADETKLDASAQNSIRKALVAFDQKRREFESAISNAPPPPTLVESMRRLEAELSALTPQQANAIAGASDAAVNLANRLAISFQKVEAAAITGKVPVIVKSAKDLTALLPKKGEAKDEGLKRILLSDETSYETLTGLEKKLNEMDLGSAGAAVRVIEAKIGDVYPEASIRSRWCDATAAMRKLCDRKANCDIPADYPVKFCGFDPAPSADPRHRGIFVRYECVRAIDDNFVGKYPVKVGVAKTTLDENRKQYVVIRGGGAILCSS